MHTGNERDSKVVSLADRNEAKKSAEKDAVEPEASLDWAEVMKRNAENASRMKKEREKANKGVIRSYRLKH